MSDDARAVAPPAGTMHFRDDALVLALVLLTAAVLACSVSADGDLGFHLATGREVLRSGRIPDLNVLSYTNATYPWRLHQWLPALAFELLYQRFGVTGVIASKMAVVAATWGVTYATARRLGALPLAAGAACIAAVAASAFRFECRPNIVTHLTLALTLLAAAPLLVEARARLTEWRERMAVLGMVAAAAIGTHLHASLDAFIALLLLAVGCALQPLYERWLGALEHPVRGLQGARPFLLAFGGAALTAGATLALYHPIGPTILTLAFRMGSDAYLAEHLVEFRPLYRLPFSMLPMVWAWLGVVAVVVATRAKRMHAAWLALLLFEGLLALRIARMAYVFAVVAAPIVAATLSRPPPRWSEPLRRPLRVFALLALAAAAPLYAFRDHTPGFGYSPYVWPLDQFAFMRARHVEGHAYVSSAWSGPFLGVFYPERKSFFDMRLEAYPPEFLREVYMPILYGKPGWDRLLDRYDVQYVLLRYTTAGEATLQRGTPNLRQRLAADPRWALVNFDDVGELFVRARGANAGLAAQLGMTCVDPDRRLFKHLTAACVAHLQAAAAAGNRAPTLLLTAAAATAAVAPSPLAVALAEEALRTWPGDRWALRVQAFVRCRVERRNDCVAP